MREEIWYCDIGGIVGKIPQGSDFKMRRAVEKSFIEITGQVPEFIFSGWGGDLDKYQREIVERDRQEPKGN